MEESHISLPKGENSLEIHRHVLVILREDKYDKKFTFRIIGTTALGSTIIYESNHLYENKIECKKAALNASKIILQVKGIPAEKSIEEEYLIEVEDIFRNTKEILRSSTRYHYSDVLYTKHGIRIVNNCERISKYMPKDERNKIPNLVTILASIEEALNKENEALSKLNIRLEIEEIKTESDRSYLIGCFLIYLPTAEKFKMPTYNLTPKDAVELAYKAEKILKGKKRGEPIAGYILLDGNVQYIY